MEEFLLVISGVLAAIAFFVVPGAFGYGIIQPITREAKGVRCPVRFLLSDILWLMLLLQLPLWFISLVMTRRDQSVVYLLGTILLLTCVAVWLRGVSTLSGLGIFDGWRRGVFLVVVMPATILGALAAAFTAAVALACAVPSKGVSLAALLPIVPVCYVLRLLTLWVLSGKRDTTASASDEVPADPEGNSEEPSDM